MKNPILSSEYRRKPVTERIAQARRVITAALGHARILRALHEFGFGKTLLQEGLALVEQAEASRATRTSPHVSPLQIGRAHV